MGLFALLAVIRLNPNIHIEIRHTDVRTRITGRSKYFSFGDHLSSWPCNGIVWRKVMLVTLRT